MSGFFPVRGFPGGQGQLRDVSGRPVAQPGPSPPLVRADHARRAFPLGEAAWKISKALRVPRSDFVLGM